MSANGLRIVALNGLVLVLAGMVLGGFPLVFVVMREAYRAAVPVTLAGDYRGWLMAHLEGLLNGLLIIAIALVARLKPMTANAERWLIASLLVAGWGNTLASIAAPLLGVRGMQFDGNLANDLVAGAFTVALVASFYALTAAIAHLARPIVGSPG